MFKKIIYVFVIVIFVASCQTFDTVKRGLTGQKRQSVDEFLVEKKDPLILPPDFENLPSPDERTAAAEEISVFENALETSIEEESPSTSRSTEESIIKQIQRK